MLPEAAFSPFLKMDYEYHWRLTEPGETLELAIRLQRGSEAAVAPFVASASPPSAPKGAVTTVTLTGQRFAAGAEVRVLAPAGIFPNFDCNNTGQGDISKAQAQQQNLIPCLTQGPIDFQGNSRRITHVGANDYSK